jgi:glycosyltransferase involved in cell wall biosynthesis
MGPAEIVRDGENGLLIPANDPETLRRALRLLMRDAALRDRLGRAARAVRDDYDPARIMAQWGRLLAGLRR